MTPEEEADVRQKFREAVESWEEWWGAWEAEVLPMFRRHGLTKGEAVLAWHLNRVLNALPADDADDDWKADAG